MTAASAPTTSTDNKDAEQTSQLKSGSKPGPKGSKIQKKSSYPPCMEKYMKAFRSDNQPLKTRYVRDVMEKLKLPPCVNYEINSFIPCEDGFEIELTVGVPYEYFDIDKAVDYLLRTQSNAKWPKKVLETVWDVFGAFIMLAIENDKPMPSDNHFV